MVAVSAREAEPTLTYDESLAALVESYEGEQIDVSFRDLVGPLPADERTHGVFPYPARLLRQIPRFVLASDRLTKDVDFVVDPFCGSGTVLVEAQRAGLPSFGLDQNPIAALASRVKTTPLPVTQTGQWSQALASASKQSRAVFTPPRFVEKWFDPAAISVLGRLSQQLQQIEEGPRRDFLAVCVALLARQIARTDKRIPVPVRTREEVPIWNARAVWSEYERISLRTSSRIGRLPQDLVDVRVYNDDSRLESAWSRLPQSGSGLVLTSPPYGAAQKYLRSTSLELAWLGLCQENGTASLERDSIGREHLRKSDIESTLPMGDWTPALKRDLESIYSRDHVRGTIYATYFREMKQVFGHMSANSGLRRVILVAGENHVSGRTLDTPGHLGALLASLGFARTVGLKDQIRGRSLLTSRRNSQPHGTSEHIDVFER